MNRVFAIAAAAIVGVIALVGWGYGYRFENLKYLFHSKSVCLSDVEINVPSAGRIIGIYDGDSKIYYHRGWWPSRTTDRLDGSQVWIWADGAEDVTVYLNYGRKIMDACREDGGCFASEGSLFAISGKFFKLDGTNFFYSPPRNMLITYSPNNLHSLASTTISESCK